MWWNPTSPHNVTILLNSLWVFMSCDPPVGCRGHLPPLEPRFLTFSHLHCQLWVFRIFCLFYFNVNVWVSRKAKKKIRKKTFESQVHKWRTKSLSLITLWSSLCCGLAAVLIVGFWFFFCFQGWEFKYSFQILQGRTVSNGGCCRLFLVCWSTSVRKHSSPVFSFHHSLHSGIHAGWRILSPAPTVRKQNVLWCYCPTGPSWVISMHNRHTPVNRSRLEVKGEWS